MKKSSRVYTLILIIVLSYSANGCKKEVPNPVLPEITTANVTEYIEDAVAYGFSGGTIISDGGSPIKSSGICWSTHELPTVFDSNYKTGTSTILERNPKVAESGSFSCYIYGIKRSTTYYVRAFATNIAGTAYGNQVSFTTSCFWYMQKFPIELNYPDDGAVVTNTNLILHWISNTMFPDIAKLYDLYLDTNPNPTTKIASNLSSDRFIVSGLNPNTTYYWKVYGWETDFPCNNTTSRIYHFKTIP